MQAGQDPSTTAAVNETPAPDENQQRRLGPRPLMLHMMLASLAWGSSLVALPALSVASIALNAPSSRGQTPPAGADARPVEDASAVDGWADLLVGLGHHSPDCQFRAVFDELTDRSAAFLAGLERYRQHPYRRRVAEPSVIWRDGGTRLLDYGSIASDGRQPGRPMLFVPSLVNRAYVLDLSSRCSLLRWLVDRGVRPLLIDWGTPGPTEEGFGLNEYIADRLIRAARFVQSIAGGAIPVAGYCMGGLLATALAVLRPDLVASLVLMATPWDFHAGHDVGDPDRRDGPHRWLDALRPLLRASGTVPVDLLQAGFTLIDPLQALRKFARFASLDPQSPRAEAFVALEDWLNDGVPLAARVAEQALIQWYADNAPAQRAWRVADTLVDPSALQVPSLHLIPAQDRIVPPPSARALAAAVPDAAVITPPLGHIGMVVSGRAVRQVWQPLADWVLDAA